MLTLTQQQVVAHRLRVHHLAERSAPSALLQAVGACGMQNTPPGSVEAAVFNRLTGLDAGALYHSLHRDRSLLQAWSIRGVPLVFPTAERAAFTAALIADGDEGWVYTDGIAPALKIVGMGFQPLLEAAQQALGEAFEAGPVVSKRTLDTRLAAAMERRLPPEGLGDWRRPSIYGPNQTMGEAVASFLLRPLSFLGLVCFGERRGASPTFVSPAEWLGVSQAAVCPEERQVAGAELARKYLHCFGPATVEMFASWLGASVGLATRLWRRIEGELTLVECGDRRGHVLTADLEAFQMEPLEDQPLRLLGPHDPYLDLRDRELICPDREQQKRVWRLQVNPGAVLLNGQIVGIWKQRTQGDRIAVVCELFRRLDADHLEAIRNEAEGWAAFRGKRLAGLQLEL